MSEIKAPSKRFTLNKEDLKSIGKGLLINLGGAALLYLADVLSLIDFGHEWWAPLATAFAAAAVNSIRKYLAGK